MATNGTWLDRVNTTNLQAVLAAALTALFVAAVTAAEIAGADMDEGVLAVVAGLIAAHGGFSWARFKTKRETGWLPPATASETNTAEPNAPRADAGAAYLADGTVRTPARGVVHVLPDYDREGEEPPPSPRPVLTDHDRGVI
jgi:hypothetical protein